MSMDVGAYASNDLSGLEFGIMYSHSH